MLCFCIWHLTQKRKAIHKKEKQKEMERNHTKTQQKLASPKNFLLFTPPLPIGGGRIILAQLSSNHPPFTNQCPTLNPNVVHLKKKNKWIQMIQNWLWWGRWGKPNSSFGCESQSRTLPRQFFHDMYTLNRMKGKLLTHSVYFYPSHCRYIPVFKSSLWRFSCSWRT